MFIPQKFTNKSLFWNTLQMKSKDCSAKSNALNTLPITIYRSILCGDCFSNSMIPIDRLELGGWGAPPGYESVNTPESRVVRESRQLMGGLCGGGAPPRERIRARSPRTVEKLTLCPICFEEGLARAAALQFVAHRIKEDDGSDYNPAWDSDADAEPCSPLIGEHSQVLKDHPNCYRGKANSGKRDKGGGDRKEQGNDNLIERIGRVPIS